MSTHAGLRSKLDGTQNIKLLNSFNRVRPENVWWMLSSIKKLHEFCRNMLLSINRMAWYLTKHYIFFFFISSFGLMSVLSVLRIKPVKPV